MKRLWSSLRFKVGLLYFLLILTLLPLTYILHKTQSEGSSSQVQAAGLIVEAACDEIQSSLARGIRNQSFLPENRGKFQDAILEIILERYEGVEGGFWSREFGFEGYAFPTYDGAGQKKDVPRSEMETLGELSNSAVESNRPQKKVHTGRREAIYRFACPVVNSRPVMAAWILLRIPITSGAEFDQLRWFSFAVLALIVMTGLGSVWIIYSWTRDLGCLRHAIENHSVTTPSILPASSNTDLQNIVDAFNDLNLRLSKAQKDAADTFKKQRQNDRLALLGQMAAGIAHEIRNPMATIKLRLENAEMNPAERLPKAAPVIVEQISRIDRLIQMLLAFAQPFHLNPTEVVVADWIKNNFNLVRSRAERKSISIEVLGERDVWAFDTFHLGRAVENLLDNAVAHTPPGGTIEVRIGKSELMYAIAIQDSGPGLTPEQKETLFDPFQSKRESGIGLGLVLAKEIVEAHGGRLNEVSLAGGACFRLEIPWPKS